MTNPLAAAPSFAKAVRAGVSCIIGIAGETGSGKSLTALRAARGLAADPGDDLQDPETLARVDARIAAIDTESERLKHYAAAEGELPRPFRKETGASFGFAWAGLHAPFTPERYLALIREADAAGFRVILTDSWSHEWDGEGGCTDMHEDDLNELVEKSRKRDGDKSWWNESTQREKLSITAWKGPKMAHKRAVGQILQCRAHLIFCMRAEDKLRIESKKERETDRFERTVITPAAKLPPRDRWVPICEKRFPFQLITSFVLTPDAPGVPIPLKLQEQHRAFIPEDEPLTEEFGVKLAAWARGAQPISSRISSPAKTSSFSGEPAAGGREHEPLSPPAGREGQADKLIWFGAKSFKPGFPAEIILPPDMTPAVWQQWGAVLRDLIELAPSTDIARAWKSQNQTALLKLNAVSPRLHSWTLEFAPPDIASGAQDEFPGDQQRSHA